MIVCHLGIDIESINIVQVFLDRTFVLKITNLVKHTVQLIVVAIVLPDDVLNFFLGSIPASISFPLFEYFTFDV